MTRRVVISGVGPVSGLGLGIADNWTRLLAGESAIEPISAFDPAGFACQIAAEVKDFKVRNFVPKSYRKATKVMARDIELAVAAADLAAKDAGLVTPGNHEDVQARSYPAERVGAHIGAGLIAVDLDELSSALAEARNEQNGFDIHRWGGEGMNHLTPLWLLKYLPNMLACHVTIIHDSQGPSNTITCGDASSGLSIGESLRVIQRGAADACFCGGTESKLNPMAFLRQELAQHIATTQNDQPGQAVRPFDRQAAGTIIGEGGGIVVLESHQTLSQRGGSPYAEVVGFGASQTVHRASRNRQPDPEGRGLAIAIRSALREAQVDPQAVDLIAACGSGIPAWDQSEAQSLRALFGDRLAQIPVLSPKANLGNCGAGAGGLDVSIVAKALKEQTIPAIINRDHPIDGLASQHAAASAANLQHALVCSIGFGGQNTAIVLKAV